MSTIEMERKAASAARKAVAPRHRKSPYPLWFLVPGLAIYVVMFIVPTFSATWFALTRWTLFDSTFIGLENFRAFFEEPFLIKGVMNTVIYATLTSAAKTVLALLLALLLTSGVMFRGLLRSLVFFPVLVSTIGIGIAFTLLMHPTQGPINLLLERLGIPGPGWLVNPRLALYSVVLVDIWRGVGIATVIYIAGLVSIPRDYYEAARVDGATKRQQFWRITLPLIQPAMSTVVILSFISGLRTFDLIWAMTKGGPGFSSDVLASIVYKQYQAGFFGLSTAGNVVLFILIALISIPLVIWFRRKEVDL